MRGVGDARPVGCLDVAHVPPGRATAAAQAHERVGLVVVDPGRIERGGGVHDEERVGLGLGDEAHEVAVHPAVTHRDAVGAERVGGGRGPAAALHDRCVAVEEEVPVLVAAPEERRHDEARRVHVDVGQPAVAELVPEEVERGEGVGIGRVEGIVRVAVEPVHAEHVLEPRRAPERRSDVERVEPDAERGVAQRVGGGERRGRSEIGGEPAREVEGQTIVVVAMRAVEGARRRDQVEDWIPALVGEEEGPVVLEHRDLAGVGGVGRGKRRALGARVVLEQHLDARLEPRSARGGPASRVVCGPRAGAGAHSRAARRHGPGRGAAQRGSGPGLGRGRGEHAGREACERKGCGKYGGAGCVSAGGRGIRASALESSRRPTAEGSERDISESRRRTHEDDSLLDLGCEQV